MEKKNNISNSELSSENNNKEDLSADGLKKRFKAGSIPLQTDYEHLIDIADIGRKATGQAPGQTDNPSSGLELNSDGWLGIKVNPNGGLKKDKDGLAAIPNTSKGINLSSSGLEVKLGAGVALGGSGNIDVNILKDSSGNNISGLKCYNSPLSVIAGNGITVNDKGVSVKANRGIRVDSSGVNIIENTETGMMITDKGLGIYLGDGLQCDSKGTPLHVKAGNGIKVDDKGVSIDPDKVLPRGMIVMFSGSRAPTGWALCDGNNGTPNLIDRFILGGDFAGVNGQSNDKTSGSANVKEFRISTTNKKLTITIKGTKLSLNQMPKHNHLGGMAYYNGTGSRYGDIKETEESKQIDNNPGKLDFMSSTLGGYRNLFSGNDVNPHYLYTSDTGNGEEHTHAVDASANIIPPYYILAFIMKL
ncbi:tail fiber protein [Photorhabdus sp. RM323S]|uniref:tail fiber protein n=1 Tax=Photorhabdus sp. RM323S TaxID=3342828 RepID=UPI0036D9676C